MMRFAGTERSIKSSMPCPLRRGAYVEEQGWRGTQAAAAEAFPEYDQGDGLCGL